jgi:arylformamidase
MLHRVDDWNDAYDNGNNIPFGHNWPALWAEAAQAFRDQPSLGSTIHFDIPYASHPRNIYDLMLPAEAAKGIVVFIHGGFWHKLDKGYFTHLSRGALERGWAFALPSYRLCPEVRVTQIVQDVTAAISAAAAKVDGPILLIGHSAGGHLVSRMVCSDSALNNDVAQRIRHVVSVSGLHDLRPLIKLSMNDTLNIDEGEAILQSPALLAPAVGVKITCWVGAAERPEFLRQNDLLANIWKGMGAETARYHQEELHHFNILDDLEEADSPLINALFSGSKSSAMCGQ